jgi:catechol 2,3-dioxygenase-like lactoylglutathione lyase family enzyme
MHYLDIIPPTAKGLVHPMTTKNSKPPVIELRVALTTGDFERMVRFYRVGLGLEPAQVWPEDQGRALVLDLGRATLEIFDKKQAETVDQLEVGRSISGAVRFALQVPDLDAAMERLLAYGATMVHKPVVTPWGDRNARFQDPDGMQITLYQAQESP